MVFQRFQNLSIDFKKIIEKFFHPCEGLVRMVRGAREEEGEEGKGGECLQPACRLFFVLYLYVLCIYLYLYVFVFVCICMYLCVSDHSVSCLQTCAM